jgi:hypothetical protein
VLLGRLNEGGWEEHVGGIGQINNCHKIVIGKTKRDVLEDLGLGGRVISQTI